MTYWCRRLSKAQQRACVTAMGLLLPLSAPEQNPVLIYTEVTCTRFTILYVGVHSTA